MKTKKDRRALPDWLRLPGFDEALELARQQAREVGAPEPSAEWLTRVALRCGLDHMLGRQVDTVRLTDRPTPLEEALRAAPPETPVSEVLESLGRRQAAGD